MRGENGVAVKKSSTKKTIEDVKSINKNNNKESIMSHMDLWEHIVFLKREKRV